MKLNAYLNFGGNCAEAFRFYEQNLGGKITMMLTHEQSPEPTNAAPGRKTDIMYARMTLANTEIMGNDVHPDRFQPMRSVYISLAVDSSPEAERIHGLLADGGEIFMPIQETFFAHRFSMLRDKFGVSWMILHQRPMPASA
jgi:PhnB protein